MHTISLLKKWCEHNVVIDHQARLSTLLRIVSALPSGGKLALEARRAYLCPGEPAAYKNSWTH